MEPEVRGAYYIQNGMSFGKSLHPRVSLSASNTTVTWPHDLATLSIQIT